MFLKKSNKVGGLPYRHIVKAMAVIKTVRYAARKNQ